MNILQVYLESGGFDYRLIRGGISVYLWNLTRAFNARGHKTGVLSALNGQFDLLSSDHGLKEIDYSHAWDCKIAADVRIWGDRVDAPIPIETRAYHLHKDGTDFYYLGNEFLDLYPDTYYPPYEGKGTDIGFFKPLIFQMEAVRFIRTWFADEDWLIHAHEPFYQYLLPTAFADDSSKTVISTVQSNMPITKKVYVPETREALRQIGAAPDHAHAAKPLPDTLFNRCLEQYLPKTHLNYPYPADYLSLFDLVLADSDGVDFLSDGHLEFYTGFYGTAFRAWFLQLDLKGQYERDAHKLFVGGCGLGAQWLDEGRKQADRSEVLGRLRLDPGLPTFFHSARYAPNHKGQNELVLAFRHFYEAGGRANLILRCITEAGVPDDRFTALAADFSDMVFFTSEMQREAELMEMADASDFALFPSKLEMDTFLIAQGEAMACGCVPIASDQLGMEHWNHGRGAKDESERTGFPVIRSFLDEDPALVSSIVDAVEKAAELHSDPISYAEMSQRARLCALKHDWQSVGDKHLAAFERIVGSKNRAPAQDTKPTTEDWRSVAIEAGQIIDRRFSGASKVPALSLDDGQLSYDSPAAAVTAFAWNGSSFDEYVMQPTAAGTSFVAKGLTSSNVFLLVTLQNGDQFWDGLVPIDRAVDEAAANALEKTA
jgi:glycosyltransferase involved in cell wall biosynthesis